MCKLYESELPTPLGKFLIENIGDKHKQIQTSAGTYYHYEDIIELIKQLTNMRLDKSSRFYKNCKTQRKRGAKICNTCPFKYKIESFERGTL